MRKFMFGACAALAVVLIAWWFAFAPEQGVVIAPAYVMGPVPDAVLAVRSASDHIGETVETLGPEIPGYDEVILQEDRDRAFVMASDGWIWRVDLVSGAAERFVDAPLMAAGARRIPGDDDRICFCASRRHGETYPDTERVGVYALEISTKTLTPLLTRVPLPPPSASDGVVFIADDTQALRLDEMNETNSRALAFCNDLDISADGRRIYFSEPFAYAGASMGAGAFDEAISMGNNGRLWMLDREAGAVSLIAQNFTFIDGVLIEPGTGPIEESVIVAEATKFRVLRLYLRGEKAGQHEVLWENLPGVPDGLDRDGKGRIWLGLLKERSGLLTWVHAHPWIKPVMLRLPVALLPVPNATGFMAMSPDASEALFYTEHDGTRVRDIAVVVPGRDHLYLACFNSARPGLHRVPYPPLPD